MAIEHVREHLKKWHRENDIMEFEVSSATVELAAKAVGVEPAKIAKTLTLRDGESAMLIVVAGDAKIDNIKFKNTFGFKARMLTADEVLTYTGHAVGGVCPFGIERPIKIMLDASLKRFDFVYPACGNSQSAIKVTTDEMAEYSNAHGWVDVCKLREDMQSELGES